jgi:serine protease Do
LEQVVIRFLRIRGFAASAAVLLCVLARAVSPVCAEPDPRRVQAAISRVLPALIRIRAVTSEFRDGREVKTESAGSGVIIREDGYAVTNHHVAGDARVIFVTLADKTELDAELVGTDPLADIAVIRLKGRPGQTFPVAVFGDSSKVRVGDEVLAMGSPVALSQSVTSGIVSNTEMILPDFWWPSNRLTLEGEDVGSMVRWIGHDALIRGGNSGGPLVNLEGEIIGINEVQMGLAGAIPSNLARAVAAELIERGSVRRSWLGLEVQPMLKSSPVSDGALVAGVLEGSPAERAGVRSGDIILKLNGQPVSVRFGEEVPLFNQMAAALPVGRPARLLLLRDGKQLTVEVVPVEREKAQPRQREMRDWGMTVRDISLLMARELHRDSRDGVYVATVASGGPADDARPPLRGGDIIVAVGGEPVRSVAELVRSTERLLEGKEGRVAALVEFERKTERYLTVVRVGQDPLRDPGLEAAKAWLPAGTQVLTADVAQALGIPGVKGFRVTEVLKGRSAEKAGLRVGDIITALDGEAIEASQPQDQEVLAALVRRKPIGSVVELSILRDGKPEKLPVELEPSPKLAREMKRYRSEDLEFTARNITFGDRPRTPSGEEKPVEGVVVESVSEGGWAAVARLAVGDIITGVNGVPVPDVDRLRESLEKARESRASSVVFLVRRGIRQLFVEVQPVWDAP